MNLKPLKLFFGHYWILFVLISIKLLVQFVFVNPVYELHRDEFLHLDQAFHPAIGYISVPPFTSWMASLIYLLGGGLFWVRFIPALFGAATIVFGWLIAETLGGKLPAKLLTSIVLIFSIYTRINVLFQPNSFDILVWTVIFYLFLKYVSDHRVKWLYLLSIVTALGLYNKYTIVFLIIGLFAGFLLTKQRSVFTKKALYYAAGLSVLLVSPTILWQITNHFPVIHHMQALKESQLVNVNRTDFLVDQLKYGLITIPSLTAFGALLFYKPFKPYRFVIWTFIVVMTLFTVSRAKSYYTLGLYPVLFAFGSVYLEVLFKRWKTILISFFAVTQMLAFFFIVKYLMPFQQPAEIIANKEAYERIGLLRWEDGLNHPLPQDFADMLGWKEMAGKALLAYNMIPADELANTLIYCENYGQAGALNYYNRTKMAEAYSFNTDYIYWIPKEIKFQHILFVGKIPGDEVINMFRDYKLVGEIENEFAREKGTKIFLLLDAKSSASNMFNELVDERKKNFDIF